jgi:rusticyanin
MKRSTISTFIRPVAVAAAVASVAAALAACGTGTTGSHPAAAPTSHSAALTSNPMYRYYQHMMGRYGGGMMGGGPGGWMMGGTGYRWMTGANGIPGWMNGGRLPVYMMGGAPGDMGQIMGRFWADAPGPRVSPPMAASLGNQIPAGAHVNRASRTITFTTTSVRLAAEASPPGGPDETFRIAGMANPTVIVPAGARVSIRVINADPDTAHGMVITSSTAVRSWMPMMTAPPSFEGSALWFLGNPTSAGMHSGTLTFTAAHSGTYRYLCAVPGHARKGMTGTFIVTTGH